MFMRCIEGLPDTVSVESLTVDLDAYGVLCLICGGGGAPATVEVCRGELAKSNALVAAQFHAEQHERARRDFLTTELREQQAAALQWSQAQADVMLWADRDELHQDGATFYRKDMHRGTGRGRTVAKARVEALIRAGFLHVAHGSVLLTSDGHAARRAWLSCDVEPLPREAELRELRPLIGGQEEARRDAELAAQHAEREAADAAAAELSRPAAEEDDDPGPVAITAAGRVALRAHTALCSGAPDAELAVYRALVNAHYDAREAQAAQLAELHRAGAEADQQPATGEQAPARENVTGQDVTQTPADAEAAWLARWAERSGALPIDGPGIIGAGTHVTYRDGHGPGMKSKHGTRGMIVAIGRKAIAWRPYGSARILRTSPHALRVHVPPTSATAEAAGRAVSWRRWSLADHLAYGRRPEALTAAQVPAQAPAGPVAAPPATEPLQLPLWPAQAPAPAEHRPAARPEAVTTASVTRTGARLAPVLPLRTPTRRVLVIPCSSTKLDHPAPVGQLYAPGSLHRLCRKAADALATEDTTTLVLSSRHGFLTLDQVVAPYAQRIDAPGAVTAEQLRDQAARLHLADATDVTVLAGAAYTAAARTVWPTATAPLAGSRGIGEMRQRLAHLARTSHHAAA
ncbi:DUF6884 domain-containing protein [Kitasatospora sp. NBC_01302]|uniref:DUF6884 domain-containing protein n=1 Tax=Kitasatospora sp. NBC_01302 TaxID=2903575 RepID=UPI002E1650F8|nr:DUF6884 domain-containing protein [Kitasatospora sp. NBC_01302]WSJ72452.1 hypothetical protein OG294_40835 [Kitasatospora sp. NBC_01302]